ncbi:molecular chaperone TorD family protein [Paraferrimonas haliotis]|uniref:Uncharacterized protein n=1 Tax=Paraferrimonas haliotis TaxID=2013866 RepID=A0AA37WXG6_9GAMM|nr:molecular chaperone TorD family protein [Paraferrimonas haliotis]GLS82430.1 hypothetical protein GCM10007894_04070 [Paraferrimonas haliotis]
MTNLEYSDVLQGFAEVLLAPDGETVNLIRGLDESLCLHLNRSFPGYSVELVQEYKALFDVAEGSLSLQMSDYFDDTQSAQRLQQLNDVAAQLKLEEADAEHAAPQDLPYLLEIAAMLAQHDINVATQFLQYFGKPCIEAVQQQLQKQHPDSFYCAVFSGMSQLLSKG